MEREYQYLLHLLGTFLLEKEPRREDVDWPRLIQLSQIHCVTGILGYMTMKYPICPDAGVNESLRSACLGTIGLFAQRGAKMDEMVRVLNREKVEHILMKGYLVREYYPVSELRTFGDIDFVIRPQDRQRVHELMLSLGFQVETDWEPVFSYVRDNEFYEVHGDIMEVDVSEKADYRGYFQSMWQFARRTDGCSYRFTPEFHFLYLLTHIAKHIHGSGAGARMYLDVAAFVKHYGCSVDWDFVRGELEKLELLDFAAVVFAAVESWFGVEAPMACGAVDSRVLRDFTEFTMEAGVFGHFQREEGVTALKNEETEKPSRFALLMHRAFPSAESIQSRYTYLQNRPWLLPVAWVHRFVKTRGTWNEHAHEAQVIMSADEREVSRLRRITREIGL